MRTEQQTTRIVRSWLEEGVTALPDRVLDTVLDQVPATLQRRPWWRAWRSPHMNNPVRLAMAAAAVLVVAVVGYQFLPRNAGFGGQPTTAPPSPSPTAQPSVPATPSPTVAGRTQTLVPFVCASAELDPGCVDDDASDDSITVRYDLPPSWSRFGGYGPPWIDENAPPDGASVWFYHSLDALYSDPCRTRDEEVADTPADVPVGPGVDDLVTALVDHPSLDVTAAVDVTLAGYSGRYLTLTVPDDISGCDRYRPLDGHIYAQGPSQRWHMWVLDVAGVRVVVETNDFPGTPPQRLAEMQSIVDSLVITP